MSKPSKPLGRPKGTTTRQRMAKELIAQGVEPLQAFTQAGFAYPAREVKRQVATVADAQGKSPVDVLMTVARYGEPVDVVSACRVLLRMGELDSDSAEKNSDYVGEGVSQIFVNYVRSETAAVAAATLPSEPVPDGTIPESDIPAGETIFETVHDVLASLESRNTPDASSMAVFARARLMALIADPSVKDAQQVQAAKELLQNHSAHKAATTRGERKVFLVPGNDRGPAPFGRVFFIRNRPTRKSDN